MTQAYDTQNQQLLYLVMGKEYSDLCTALGSMEFKRVVRNMFIEGLSVWLSAIGAI